MKAADIGTRDVVALRALLLLLCALAASPAGAQVSPAAHEVALIAPQLEAFAGSRENFESLANGLRNAASVTLTTTSDAGVRDIVTFTPAEPLAATETARLLERARQLLIAHGIGHPGAVEIGVALMGGALKAPSGDVKLPALVAAADPKKPLAVSQTVLAGSAANYKSLVEGLSKDGKVTLTAPGNPDTTFTVPGGTLSADETKEAIRLASGLLAAQGIHDPTPGELRAALVGGNVTTPDKRAVLLYGVLQGRARATSASPARATSESTGTGHTSDRPSTGFTSDSPAPRSNRPPAAATPEPARKPPAKK
jgi:hypothetical protein